MNNQPLDKNNALCELQRQASLALSISELIASLTHESSNLVYSLGVYFGALDHVLSQNSGNLIERKKAKHLVEQIRKPLDQLISNFEKIHQYRSFGEFKQETVQIEEVAESTARLINPRLMRNRIRLKKSWGTAPPILCDSAQIQHVLLNILINALEAIGQNGTIMILTELHDGDFVRIQITDSGVGIPANRHPRIFEPYFTTKEFGMGLGLTVSQYIVKTHGGRIEFDSKVAAGAKFVIYLPVGK